MSCFYCHESTPPNRRDGFCSDICLIHSLRAEIDRLRIELKASQTGVDALQGMVAQLRREVNLLKALLESAERECDDLLTIGDKQR